MLSKKDLLKDEMPSLSIQRDQHSISYLNMIFNHKSTNTYDIEMYFKIEPSQENQSIENSISGEFKFFLHVDFQGIIDLVEPLMRERIGVADTTYVEINFVRIYIHHIERGLFRMGMECRATCSAAGCGEKEHKTEIDYTPEIFRRVNKVLEPIGFRFNIEGEHATVAVDSNRFELMDMDK